MKQLIFVFIYLVIAWAVFSIQEQIGWNTETVILCSFLSAEVALRLGYLLLSTFITKKSQ